MSFVSDFIGDLTGANKQAEAAQNAAQTQAGFSQQSIDEQRRQFNALQQMLSPFVNAGTGALGAQQNILGLNGASAQQAAYDGVRSSPAFTSAQQVGQNAILQNASATGGLRGGNTQAALAQFSPQLLTQLIQQQYGNLGGLSSLGQNAAAGVGNAGQSSANSISTLLGQQGAALAGGTIAGGNAQANSMNSLSSGIGFLGGNGGAGLLSLGTKLAGLF